MADLQKSISDGIGISPESQLLKCGVPPVQLSSDLGHAVKLLEIGIRNRDTIVLEELERRACGAEGLEAPCSASSNAVGQPKPDSKKRKSEHISTGDPSDARASEILPAFDRAIAAAAKHVALLPEDKHQVFALRKGKAAVVASLKRGDNISLSAMHTLTGVGHWVVQQVKEHMSDQSEPDAASKRSSRGAPPPTPSDFTWKYLDRHGKSVVFRNDAEMSMSPTGPIFRVSLLHGSGRVEKAWLPDAKAPAVCPHADSSMLDIVPK